MRRTRLAPTVLAGLLAAWISVSCDKDTTAPSPSPLPPVPPAPTRVTASARHGQMTISWNSVSGATSYTLTSNTNGVLARVCNSAIWA